MFNFKYLSRFAMVAVLAISLAACSDDTTNGGETTYVETVSGDTTYITVTDNGEGAGTRTWEAERNGNPVVYILDGHVFVNDGQVLTIEPGAKIKGKAGQGENASSLVIARGGQCNCAGTEQNPIIFTAEADPLDGSYTADIRGQWGGVIVLGRAPINVAAGEKLIEGLPETDDRRGFYGGTNAADNSGTFRYISIRHAGTDLGDGDEINGFTMGGVGSGTTVENIEVWANNDDGFEWFGGTVNGKWLVSSYCGDDAFDWDEGFQGNLQFLLVAQASTVGNRGAEMDGAPSSNLDTSFFSKPTVYNATYICNGATSGENEILLFRDNTGGAYYNSIFIGKRYAMEVEDLTGSSDSRNRLETGDLIVTNNVWFDFDELADTAWRYIIDTTVTPNDTTDSLVGPFVRDYLVDPSRNNLALPSGQSPVLNTNTALGGGFNPLLNASTTGSFSPRTPPSNGFFNTAATYPGAFDASTNWAAWTNTMTKLGN